MTLRDDTNRQIAKFCGWKWWRYKGYPRQRYSGFPKKWTARLIAPDHHRFSKTVEKPKEGDIISDLELPDFTTSRDACAEFERLVEERGKFELYTYELIYAIKGTCIFPSNAEQLKPIIRATAGQRCAAMIAALKGAE